MYLKVKGQGACGWIQLCEHSNDFSVRAKDEATLKSYEDSSHQLMLRATYALKGPISSQGPHTL